MARKGREGWETPRAARLTLSASLTLGTSPLKGEEGANRTGEIMLRLLLPILLFAAPAALAQDAAPTNRAVLDAFIEAFNAQDVDAMADLVSDDVQVVYLGVSGVDSRVDGVDRLTRSMQVYFRDLPSARSEVLSVIEDGNRLAVRERASWTSASGEARSQTALSVYRIRGGLIAAVWYFPATPEAN